MAFGLGRGVVNEIGPSNVRRGRGSFGGGAGWVLTRLHARYDKQSLSDDLLLPDNDLAQLMFNFARAPHKIGYRVGINFSVAGDDFSHVMLNSTSFPLCDAEMTLSREFVMSA